MDSLTHLVLGGSIAAAIVPARWRRKALLAGAAFGSLPDMDVPVLALVSDPVTRMTWHRGPAHALLLVVPIGLLLCWALRRWWSPVRDAPRAWTIALMLALLSHPLIDALTVYGTQLWWPAPAAPTMWATLFIIDPMVLMPLAIGAIAAWWWNQRPRARSWAVGGLAVCIAYVGWSVIAKQFVDRSVTATLAGTPLADAPRFSVPSPFNTLLWRVVVMTPDGYLEGERSLVADRGPIRFRAYRSEVAALASAAAAVPDAARLRWWSRGFEKAELRGDELVLSDLRMGSEPDYFFRYAIARRVGGGWQAIPPRRVPVFVSGGTTLGDVWRRIWSEPPAPREGVVR